MVLTAAMKNLDSPFVSGVLRRFASDLGLDREDAFAAYRALVDRAQAACVKRQEETLAFAPAILVTTQTIGGVAHVSICDNGEALPPGEVRQLYSAIRTGRAGAVQRALIASGVDGAESIVGRLGVSLLSSFVIADRVTITTRAHTVRAEAGIRFVCDSRTYSAEPYRVARPGTIVQLRIRPEQAAMATPALVRDALEGYAQTLALPVRINV
jgi:molecular chaperone HtpG